MFCPLVQALWEGSRDPEQRTEAESLIAQGDAILMAQELTRRSQAYVSSQEKKFANLAGPLLQERLDAEWKKVKVVRGDWCTLYQLHFPSYKRAMTLRKMLSTETQNQKETEIAKNMKTLADRLDELNKRNQELEERNSKAEVKARHIETTYERKEEDYKRSLAKLRSKCFVAQAQLSGLQNVPVPVPAVVTQEPTFGPHERFETTLQPAVNVSGTEPLPAAAMAQPVPPVAVHLGQPVPGEAAAIKEVDLDASDTESDSGH